MAVRKKWSTTTLPTLGENKHPSLPAVYRYVEDLASVFKTGELQPGLDTVTIWCDEGIGFGRQEYVTIRLTDYPIRTEES